MASSLSLVLFFLLLLSFDASCPGRRALAATQSLLLFSRTYLGICRILALCFLSFFLFYLFDSSILVFLFLCSLLSFHLLSDRCSSVVTEAISCQEPFCQHEPPCLQYHSLIVCTTSMPVISNSAFCFLIRALLLAASRLLLCLLNS